VTLQGMIHPVLKLLCCLSLQSCPGHADAWAGWEPSLMEGSWIPLRDTNCISFGTKKRKSLWVAAYNTYYQGEA